jgi:hypothetical protein
VFGRGGLGRAAIGLAISLVAIVVVIRSVDLQAAWDALREADPQWIALLVAFVVADVLLRTIRWRLLLSPIGDVPYPVVLSSLLVGYLANNVLPARLGEFVRTHDLGERTSLSRSTILGTIVVERLVDTVVVVSIAAVAILVLSVRGVVASAVLVGLALTALLVVGIGVGMAAHRLPGADRVATFLGRWPQVRDALRRLREGLAIARHARIVGGAVFLSVLSWSCTVLAFAAAAQAVGVQPTIGQAALLAAGTNLATAIPAAPGYVGTFELAAVTIAASVGIPAESALAFAVLIHATTLILTSVGGAVAYFFGPRRRVARKVDAAVAAGAPTAASSPDAVDPHDARASSQTAAEPER